MTTTNWINRIHRIHTWEPILFIGIVLFAVLIASVPVRAEVGVLDGNEDFKLLATRGFAQAVDGPHAEGTPLNSYAWSMEWFNGALLVGTLKDQGTFPAKEGPDLALYAWRYRRHRRLLENGLSVPHFALWAAGPRIPMDDGV